MALTLKNQLAVSFKRALGKAHTSALAGPENETLASFNQLGTDKIFSSLIQSSAEWDTSTAGDLYKTGSAGATQFVRLTLVSIGSSEYAAGPGSTITSDTNGIDDNATVSSISTFHAYALKLADTYQTDTAAVIDPLTFANGQAPGAGAFINGYTLTGSAALPLGTLQLVPPTFGSGYTITLRNSAGTNISPLSPIEWYLDYSNGVLFVQENASTIAGGAVPAYVDGYIYTGKYLDETLTALSNTTSTSGGSGNYISSSNGNNIVSASNENILVQGNYTSTPVTIANLSTISASFGVSVVASAGFTGSLQGTGSWAQVAVSASIVDVTTNNATYYPVFVTAAGNQGLNIDTTTLSYNPNTNVLTTTASAAATASNISTAFVGGTVAPSNQILISNGAGQVTGSGLLSFNPATDGGQLIAGAVTIDQNSFSSTSNTFDFGFGSGPGRQTYIQITNANTPALATITFNLSASFVAPTTFANAQNTTFDDQFILLGSGSSQLGQGHKDSGIVFEYGDKIGTGSALFFDGASTKRLAFRYSASIADTDMAPQAFVNMTFVQGLNGAITSRDSVDTLFNAVGGDNTADHTMKGFMFIDTDGNIYIKA